eukprot:6942404-Prorocentrum_lima.AAC.1
MRHGSVLKCRTSLRGGHDISPAGTAAHHDRGNTPSRACNAMFGDDGHACMVNFWRRIFSAPKKFRGTLRTVKSGCTVRAPLAEVAMATAFRRNVTNLARGKQKKCSILGEN